MNGHSPLRRLQLRLLILRRNSPCETRAMATAKSAPGHSLLLVHFSVVAGATLVMFLLPWCSGKVVSKTSALSPTRSSRVAPQVWPRSPSRRAPLLPVSFLHRGLIQFLMSFAAELVSFCRLGSC